MKLNPNVAEQEVVDIQSVTLRIKQIVLESVSQGLDKKLTEQKLRAIISSVAFADEQLTATTQKTLRNLARNLYWQHSIKMRKLAKQYEKDIRQADPSYRLDPLVGFNPIVEIDRYRNQVDDATKGLPTIERYQQLVRAEVEALSQEPPITKIRKADGTYKEYSLRNLAEIKVRFNANNEDLKEFKDSGTDLVFTSSHADSSVRCQAYQGKLYSISGRTGRTPDGETFTPLDNALLGPDGDGNGIISGYNCRHRLIPYQQGLRPPEEYSRAEIKRERTIDQRQRYLENQIRNTKMKESANRAIGDKARADELNGRWKQLESRYQAYSLRNGRAFYRWRYQVSRNEL